MAENCDIVIIGSGLAGTAALLHELENITKDSRVTPDAPVNIVIVERYPQQKFGGVAYGSASQGQRLNLSANSPTVFPKDDMPPGFPSFAGYIRELADREIGQVEKEAVLKQLQDPPRPLFSQYLQHLTELATERAGGKANITVRIGEVLETDLSETPRKLQIRDEDGETRTLEARKMVTATGQKEPVQHPAAENVVSSSRYLEDPYGGQANNFFQDVLAEQASRKAAGEDVGSVMIMGTGLTGQDAAIRLKQSGYEGKIVMVSRNALEHAAYGATSTENYLANGLTGEPRPEKIAELERRPPRFMAVVEAAKQQGANYPGSVETDLVQSMQREFAVHMRKGYTSEEVLGHWERFIPDIGEALSDDACLRLFNQYATLLTTHRVGTTPENARILNGMCDSGQLEVTAGFISTRADERMREGGNGIEVTLTPTQRTPRADAPEGARVPRAWDADAEAGAQTETRTFSRVVSGMGYSVDYSNTRDPFWRSMIDKGYATPHRKAGDGVELAPDFTLLNANGERVEGVAVVGIPAVGATMFGRTRHFEKAGEVSGGRFPPFYGNIAGIAGGAEVAMKGLHESLMQERAREAAIAREAEAQQATGLTGDAVTALAKAAQALKGMGSDVQQSTRAAVLSGQRQAWEEAAGTLQQREGSGKNDQRTQTDDAVFDLAAAAAGPRAASQEQAAPVRRG